MPGSAARAQGSHRSRTSCEGSHPSRPGFPAPGRCGWPPWCARRGCRRPGGRPLASKDRPGSGAEIAAPAARGRPNPRPRLFETGNLRRVHLLGMPRRSDLRQKERRRHPVHAQPAILLESCGWRCPSPARRARPPRPCSSPARRAATAPSRTSGKATMRGSLPIGAGLAAGCAVRTGGGVPTSRVTSIGCRCGPACGSARLSATSPAETENTAMPPNRDGRAATIRAPAASPTSDARAAAKARRPARPPSSHAVRRGLRVLVEEAGFLAGIGQRYDIFGMARAVWIRSAQSVGIRTVTVVPRSGWLRM